MTRPALSPEEWQKVQDLFLEVLSTDPSLRAARLSGLDEGEAWLREEVGSLLESADDGPLGDPEPERAWHGRYPEWIGDFRVVRPLGEGGMGSVLLAVRERDGFSQVVALKLIRADVLDPRVEQRFEEERRILARLEHPSVARLIDGGVTPEGRPFVAMEHVKGDELMVYCDRARLSVEARIELFIEICGAVHYAHQQLVVHRDLKPSNILVTEGGRPKLLDFGIAKVLEEEVRDGAATRTTPWVTPAYASPEQLRGEPVTTLSDVYSLGVILYELLAGVPPYRTRGLSPAELERVVCETMPPRPSTVTGSRRAELDEATAGDHRDEASPKASLRATTPERLRRKLSGDLDTIVLKALAKEPGRRYGSAAAFAEDLRRYLDGLPVLARPDRLTYRVGKFVRRHRTPVALGALAVLSLGFGVIVATVQANRAERQARIAAQQRDRAEAEADKARLVTALVGEVLALGDPAAAAGDTLTAREVLDRGTARIREELAVQPELQAGLMLDVARVYHNLGLDGRARELALESVEASAELDPAGTAHAAALGFLGELTILEGRVAEGLDIMRDAVELLEADGGPRDTLRAALESRMAWELRTLGRSDEAERLFAGALEVQREVLGDDHPATARTRLGLAATLHDRQSFDEAEALFRDLLESGGELEPSPAAAEALLNLGMLRRLSEAFAEAGPLLESGYRMRVALHGPDHPAVFEAADEYGAGLYEIGRLREARDVLMDSYRRAVASLGWRHEITVDVGETLSLVEGRYGLFAAALARYDSVFEAKSALRGVDHPGVTFSIVRRADIHRDAGAWDAAERLYQEALQKTGPESTYRALALGGLGELALARDRAIEGALRGVEQAIGILTAGLRPNHRYVIDVRRTHAGLLLRGGSAEAAAAELEEILAMERELRPEPHPDLGDTLARLGSARLALGDERAAAEAFAEAARHLERLAEGHPARAALPAR